MWTAAQGLLRYLDAGLPAERVKGRLAQTEVGQPGALAVTGQRLERVLPAFTSNVAALLVTLTEEGSVADVMARGRSHLVDGPPVLGRFEESGA